MFLQASRAEGFINSKAIEAVGLDKMNQPWIMRDASGRATGVIGAGGGAVRKPRNSLMPQTAGGPTCRWTSIRASSLAMLHDLNKAGLTASGGGCQWEDLYREFREGKASMRFFCFRTAPGGRGAGAVEQQLAADSHAEISRRRRMAGPYKLGRELRRRRRDDLYSATQQPVAQESWDLFGRFAREVARAGIQALLHTQTGEHRGKLRSSKSSPRGFHPTPSVGVDAHGRRHSAADRADEELNMFIAVHPREIITGGLLRRVHGDKALAMPPLREIQDSGIMWGLGTDAFEVNQYRPFQTLYWAVTGKMVGGTVVNTHPVSREAALIAHTRSNAYLFFRENDLGSIQAGRFADLVVIDRDYLTIPADQIKDIKSMMTMVGGTGRIRRGGRTGDGDAVTYSWFLELSATSRCPIDISSHAGVAFLGLELAWLKAPRRALYLVCLVLTKEGAVRVYTLVLSIVVHVVAISALIVGPLVATDVPPAPRRAVEFIQVRPIEITPPSPPSQPAHARTPAAFAQRRTD